MASVVSVVSITTITIIPIVISSVTAKPVLKNPDLSAVVNVDAKITVCYFEMRSINQPFKSPEGEAAKAEATVYFKDLDTMLASADTGQIHYPMPGEKALSVDNYLVTPAAF